MYTESDLRFTDPDLYTSPPVSGKQTLLIHFRYSDPSDWYTDPENGHIDPGDILIDPEYVYTNL